VRATLHSGVILDCWSGGVSGAFMGLPSGAGPAKVLVCKTELKVKEEMI